MNTKLLYGLASLAILSPQAKAIAKKNKPNLLFIMTDEHTNRAISCYRERMHELQAYTWGKEAVVNTPNIDRLAKEGAIFTNFYASSPVSTPSRGSFQTGLYPINCGTPINGMAMDANKKTFATVLADEGYHTAIVGKWHLAGTPYLKGRLYNNPGYHFGYKERDYAFETNHQKWYREGKEAGQLYPVNDRKSPNENYSTDFLTTKAIEVMERQGNEPFCLFLSLPDPHSPEIAREPYVSQFKNMKIQPPITITPDAIASRPLWATQGKCESRGYTEKAVREYFGMVQCIDDNIGRILDYLDENGLADNTIVVFTADHGEMLYTHNRVDKGLPYDDSSRIPFLVRYPGKVKAGKVIEKTYTSCDFPPSILGLMGAKGNLGKVDGIDDSKTWVNKDMEVQSDRIIYMTDSPFNDWTAATDGRYVLVLSCRDVPWLFDKKKDPLETINFYDNPEYKEIAKTLQESLIAQMKQYNEPALALGKKYLYSSDDIVTEPYIYEGQTFRQISDEEAVVLPATIYQIHDKCYRNY